MGSRVYDKLNATIKTKADLLETNYRDVLKEANYRWGVDDGFKGNLGRGASCAVQFGLELVRLH